MKSNYEDIRVVKVKTVSELLSSGWEMDSEGNFHPADNKDDVAFIHNMKYLHNKIIPIRKGYTNQYIYGTGPRSVIITDNMISEEYNPEDYPEFFI